jgi:hypothetical protein
MPPDDRDLLRYEFRPVLKRLNLYYQGFGWHAFRRQNVTWRQTVGNATALEAQTRGRTRKFGYDLPVYDQRHRP